MIVITAKDINKSYGVDVILQDISFHVNKGERIGIVGLNGAGKTTLLKILTGELEATSGNLFISNDLSVGYMKQNDAFEPGSTVIEAARGVFEDVISLERQIDEMTASADENYDINAFDSLHQQFQDKGGYTYKGEIKGILGSMGFPPETYEKRVDTLSGGERTRLSMACLLLRKPDILLLDEPTNHLDIDTLRWLEQYLKNYNGTMLVVSHDRYFLDKVAGKIFEVENHKLEIYNGNYSFYAAEKKERRRQQMHRYRHQQEEIKKQEDMIRRFKQRGTEKLAKRARSREKMLEHTQVMDRPDALSDKMKISFKENYVSGKDVLLAENISKSFGYGQNRRLLFEGVSFDIKRGEKIGIVGPNGIGKTTLLKIIMGQLAADSGRLKIGHNVEFAYYDQEQKLLDGHGTVMDEIHDSYRLYTDTEVRSILGRFLFRGEDVFLPVDALSGGEKARLSIVKLMLQGANVLILDEPTNHLDIDSKEVFEDALAGFDGTVIAVSHDRYFLNKIPDRILEIQSDGMSEYLGKYDYYAAKKDSLKAASQQESSDGDAVNDSTRAGKENGDRDPEEGSAEARRRKKEQEAEERRRQRRIDKLEAEIEELETRIADLENEMCSESVLADHVRLKELSDECEEAKAKLEDAFEQWAELQ